MIPRQVAIATAILFTLAIGMSLYVWQLRRREVSNPRPVAAVQHVEPPASGPMDFTASRGFQRALQGKPDYGPVYFGSEQPVNFREPYLTLAVAGTRLAV
jgi:hypothetical protein